MVKSQRVILNYQQKRYKIRNQCIKFEKKKKKKITKNRMGKNKSKDWENEKKKEKHMRGLNENKRMMEMRKWKNKWLLTFFGPIYIQFKSSSSCFY